MEAPIPVISLYVIDLNKHKKLTRITNGKMPLSLMTLGRLTIKLSANTRNILFWHYFHWYNKLVRLYMV
jgi:hypothetical protein